MAVFVLRTLGAGTVVAAHFLHPATDDLGTPMMFGRTTYNHTPSDLKHYCMARNNLVNLRDYRGEGIQHMGIEVDDLDAVEQAVADARASRA